MQNMPKELVPTKANAPRHFIDTQEYSAAELHDILKLIGVLKAADRAGACPTLLQGASLGMIFEEPSTRTRLSFEVAMTKLGGHAIYLKPGEIHLGQRENIRDTAKVMSRMVDAIQARTLKHQTMLDLATHADVPVINGLTDYNHPTQALSDIFTMMEHLPLGKSLNQLRVTFIGDATNVCASLMMICTQLGLHFTHAAPKRYQAPETWQEISHSNAAASGGSLRITEDVINAVSDADFIYTDLWWWVGQESEIPDRTRAFMPRFQVNTALLRQAPAHAQFMHCLPASRGVEVTDAVMDGPQSIIYDQSENRLHTEKALLAYLVYPRLKHAKAALRADFCAQAEAPLKSIVLSPRNTLGASHVDTP
jgi:putrescine carbamoyltransferase